MKSNTALNRKLLPPNDLGEELYTPEDSVRTAREPDFRSLFDLSPDPMWVYDRETLRFLLVNAAARETYGYTEEEFFSLTLADIRPAEDVARMRETVEQLSLPSTASQGVPHHQGMWRHRWKNGDLRYVEVHTRPILYQGRQCALAIIRDVTETKRANELRQQAEEAVRESEARFRSMFDSAAIGITLVEIGTGRYTEVNDAFCRFLGYSREELLGMTVGAVSFPGDMEENRLLTARCIAGEIPSYHMQKRYLHRDGHLVWGELAGSVVRDTEGNPLYIIGQVNDATERKRATEALQENEQQLRFLVNNVSEIIFRTDAEGRWTFLSASWETKTGYSCAETLGASVFDFVVEEERPRFRALLESAMRRENAGVAPDIRFLARDGSVLCCAVSLNAENTGEALDVPGVYGTLSDVTERRQLQEQMLRTDKLAALGELVAGIAHEINNPLAAASGHAQLLQMHPDPEVRQDATAVRNATDRAARIVRSLLTFARQDDKEYERHTIPVSRLLETCEDLVRVKLRRADIALQVVQEPPASPAEHPLINVNETHIEQVLVNLISNAEHALRSSPPDRERHITLRTWQESRTFTDSPALEGTSTHTDWVAIAVEDNGPGIDPKILGRIFDPFFTTKPAGEGTGLGLSMCHSIAQAHGGILTVENHPGQGATFLLRLPAA